VRKRERESERKRSEGVEYEVNCVWINCGKMDEIKAALIFWTMQMYA